MNNQPKEQTNLVPLASKQPSKEQINEYCLKQVKVLAYLHKSVSKEFQKQNITISDDLIERYAVTAYIQAQRKFDI